MMEGRIQTLLFVIALLLMKKFIKEDNKTGEGYHVTTRTRK